MAKQRSNEADVAKQSDSELGNKMGKPDQLHLIPLTKDEQIQALREALMKHGKHSLYCCWVYDRGTYDRSLGCTCGLAAALEDYDE